MTASAHHAKPPPHPSIYLIPYLPYGIASGYVTVTLAWLLSHAGASVEAVAAIGGMSVLPNTWKVLWAPLIDTTLSSKWWFMISIVLTGAGIAATGLLPLQISLLPAFSGLVLVVSLTSTISGMAIERMMAFDTPDHQKGQAAGWSQAGNLGGAGLGGGAGLWIATHGQPWIAAVMLALISAACAIPLIWLEEPGSMKQPGRNYGQILLDTGRDVWTLVKTRIGLMACFICLLPLGTGGAQQLWAAIAKDWHAGADQVALVSGLLSGLVSIPGAVVGGWLADHMDRKRAYILYGLVSAASGLLIAFGPRTPMAFMVLVTVYNFVIGACYGAYAAVTLEAIGHGAAATKFNLVSSISNMPILWVTLIDGWADARWGSRGMLTVEAGLGVAAAILYGVVATTTRSLSWSTLFGGRGRAPAVR